MAVTTPRETWTDPRIDDLSKKVNEGFEEADKKMDDGFARVDSDVRELRGEMNLRFDQMDVKFDKKFDRLLWGLLAVAVSSSATLIHALASQGG
jgi:hypothetical protein